MLQQFSHIDHTSEALLNRSCCSQVFFKTGVLKNFAILAGKRLCWSLFLIKIDQSFRLATLLKKHSNTGVFL